MLELKSKGLALREIAKIVGLSQEGVRQTIKKYEWIRGKVASPKESAKTKK